MVSDRNHAEKDQRSHVARLSNGNLVSVWRDRDGGSDETFDTYTYGVTAGSTSRDGGGKSVIARLSGPAGGVLGDSFVVSSEAGANYDDTSAQVAALAGGAFVVSWKTRSFGTSQMGLRARVFNAVGTPTSADIIVETDGLDDWPKMAVTSSQSPQLCPALTCQKHGTLSHSLPHSPPHSLRIRISSHTKLRPRLAYCLRHSSSVVASQAFPDGSGFVLTYGMTTNVVRGKIYSASGALTQTLTDQVSTDAVTGGGTLGVPDLSSAVVVAIKPDSTGFVVVHVSHESNTRRNVNIAQYDRAGNKIGNPIRANPDFITTGSPTAVLDEPEDPSAAFLINGELVCSAPHHVFGRVHGGPHLSRDPHALRWWRGSRTATTV